MFRVKLLVYYRLYIWGACLYVSLWSAGFQRTEATSVAQMNLKFASAGQVLAVREVERVPIGSQDSVDGNTNMEDMPSDTSDPGSSLATTTPVADDSTFPEQADTLAADEHVACSLNSQCTQWKAACVKGRCKCVSPWFQSPGTNQCIRMTFKECNKSCQDPTINPGAGKHNKCGEKYDAAGFIIFSEESLASGAVGGKCECASGYTWKYPDDDEDYTCESRVNLN